MTSTHSLAGTHSHEEVTQEIKKRDNGETVRAEIQCTEGQDCALSLQIFNVAE